MAVEIKCLNKFSVLDYSIGSIYQTKHFTWNVEVLFHLLLMSRQLSLLPVYSQELWASQKPLLFPRTMLSAWRC